MNRKQGNKNTDGNSGLSSIVFSRIRDDIIKEVYPLGGKLPSERELSSMYKASRFAVREAIAMLVQNGFVETHPKSGTYIKDFQKEGSLDTLVQTLYIRRTIEKETLDSLLKFRFTTETNAAAEAAGRIKVEDIEHLTKNLEMKKGHLDDIPVLTDCDYDFHFSIITISGNIISRLIFQSFKPIYSFFTEFFYSLPGAAEKSLELNWKLVEALKRKDASSSSEAMGKILRFGEEKVYEAINEQDRLIVIQPGPNIRHHRL